MSIEGTRFAPRRQRGFDDRLLLIDSLASWPFGDISAGLFSTSRRQGLKQLRFADGLYQVRIEARVSRPLPILRLSPSGQSNEGGSLTPGTESHRSRRLVPIHLRHAEVEQDDVRL